MAQTLRERFDAKVDKTATCWFWTGATAGKRYGVIRETQTRRMLYAHRVSHELFIGPIPAGLQIDHLCRNTTCVNPAHLEAVTRRENLLRGDTISAAAAGRTHCPSGHPYDAENTYRTKVGGRKCRTCHRERVLASYYRKKSTVVTDR